MCNTSSAVSLKTASAFSSQRYCRVDTFPDVSRNAANDIEYSVFQFRPSRRFGVRFASRRLLCARTICRISIRKANSRKTTTKTKYRRRSVPCCCRTDETTEVIARRTIRIYIYAQPFLQSISDGVFESDTKSKAL